MPGRVNQINLQDIMRLSETVCILAGEQPVSCLRTQHKDYDQAAILEPPSDPVFILIILSATMIKFSPIEFLGVSRRIPHKIKNAVYRF